MAARRVAMDGAEFSNFSCARWNRALRPVSGAKRCASSRRTNSSSVGGVSWFAAQRSVKRLHRTLTGASTLTRRKNGRRSRASTTSWSQMSVVTHRSFHLNVTSSNSESMSGNVYSASSVVVASAGTVAFEADFSTDGVAAVRAKRMRLKPCSWTRYEAIEDLPAQIPGIHQSWKLGAM